MSFICEYCNKEFSYKYNLTKHKKNARYCLKLQGRKVNTPTYKCEECGKEYLRSDKYEQHIKTCSNKSMTTQPEIYYLSQQINLLQSQIISMMNATGTISNSNNNSNNTDNSRNMVVQNLQPITDADMQQHVERLTLDFILEGAKGFADFANCYPFKDKLVCTDRSRKKIKYRGQDGELVDDPYGKQLTQLFFQSISEKNTELINGEYKALQEQVADIAINGTAANVNLPALLTKSVKLQDTLRMCNEAASGGDNELTQEFIRQLTKKL